MTRQEKIQLLEAVRNGMPMKFLTYGTHPVLFKNQSEAVLYHGTDTITEDERLDRKSTRLNSSHTDISRMPSSA